MNITTALPAAERARFIQRHFPTAGLFAGQTWRTSPAPFLLSPGMAKEIESLGRVLLQFYRAVNMLYRQSVAGKQPGWIAAWLDQGKPAALTELQRASALKNELPRVIRPDIVLTETGMAITELDAVPGGIGLTAWLNQTYARLEGPKPNSASPAPAGWAASGHPVLNGIIGGADGMLRGFESIFGDAPRVHIVVSEEASTYRPEMGWLASELGNSRFNVETSEFKGFADGDAIYRFFELFDLANVPNARLLFEAAEQKRIRLTPPAKAFFEEKILFALLWNRNLSDFWRRELGESFFRRLLQLIPYTWIVDPSPLPPHGAIPELNLTDWHQLKALSQRERELILKVSGYSEEAWGARGVYLGSDLSSADWSAAIDKALGDFERSPCVLQRYHKPRMIDAQYFDFAANQSVPMPGRVRLCPYYFIAGEGDASRPQLGGVLATICPADKKIIHGMKEAILAPCAV